MRRQRQHCQSPPMHSLFGLYFSRSSSKHTLHLPWFAQGKVRGSSGTPPREVETKHSLPIQQSTVNELQKKKRILLSGIYHSPKINPTFATDYFQKNRLNTMKRFYLLIITLLLSATWTFGYTERNLLQKQAGLEMLKEVLVLNQE